MTLDDCWAVGLIAISSISVVGVRQRLSSFIVLIVHEQGFPRTQISQDGVQLC
jgi:hypothetical protein